MKTECIALLFALSCLQTLADTPAPPLPPVDDIFTVAVLKYSGNKFYPEFQFDEESFLETYPKLIPSKVDMPIGIDFIWQNGVIVTKDKKVLFWRTCDKRFIVITTLEGVYYYGVSEEVSLDDRK